MTNLQAPTTHETAVSKVGLLSRAKSAIAWLGSVVLVSMVLVGGLKAVRGLNPLATERTDRSQPALLSAITSISDYRAASAQFTVVVDLEDASKWMPSVIAGERTVLLASGSVDAGVDFSHLGNGAVAIDKSANSAHIVIPHARLRKAQLDLEHSVVVAHDRGLLNRIGDAVGSSSKSETKALAAAQDKLNQAAKASTVAQVAETNTRAMLTSMLRGLGFNAVSVDFTG